MTQIDERALYGDHDPGAEPLALEGLSARRAALSVLEHVFDRKQTLDYALDAAEGFRALPARDKAFCRMLVATVLRRRGQIDDLIQRAEDRPSSKPPLLQHILRLGVAQIFFMEIADHAAVDTAVNLAESCGLGRQKGFVNAVLRTMIRTGREWIERQDEVRLNTPEWLLKIWIEDYGLRGAAEIAKANLSEAPLDITIRDAESKNYWAGCFKATELLTGSLRKLSGGSPVDMDGFEEGYWWVQDASAAIPARLFGALDLEGQSVLDLCAAPGGKTMQLAAMGAHVTALDRSASRIKRLEENVRRVRLEDRVKVIVSDASAWRPPAPVPLILLDAPCSATGTIRRHPDVPYLKTAQDIDRLVQLQTRIFDNAFEMLAPGGLLVYCTCSLQKSEGERQVEAFLERHPDARRIPIGREELNGFDESLTDEGDLRVLPYHQAALGGMDGFYIARLTKLAGQ
ncbi:MAG: MFS transporter [Alphaproteobacteria bacterium]|nr:MFS transporter [Alphaproteobacteria bacterium]